ISEIESLATAPSSSNPSSLRRSPGRVSLSTRQRSHAMSFVKRLRALLFRRPRVEAEPSGRCQQRRRPRRWRLNVEHLEDRTVPSTLRVNTALDEVIPGDGMLSLREAISAANSGDKIVFDAALAGQTISLVYGELLV